MTLHTLGELTLTLSTGIYFVWFIPQVILNFKRRGTRGFSLWMHSLLVLGCMADLMYGFGRHMPIQYRSVTVVSLISLAILHYQFFYFGFRQEREKNIHIVLTVFFVSFLVFVIYDLTASTHGKLYYDFAGLVSLVCWVTSASPQILKNYKNKSTEGLSTIFVFLLVVSGACDVFSAFALDWDFPSRLNAPIGLLQKLFLLGQCYYYKNKNTEPDIVLPSNVAETIPSPLAGEGVACPVERRG